jgi:hypothetical protein
MSGFQQTGLSRNKNSVALSFCPKKRTPPSFAPHYGLELRQASGMVFKKINQIFNH